MPSITWLKLNSSFRMLCDNTHNNGQSTPEATHFRRPLWQPMKLQCYVASDAILHRPAQRKKKDHPTFKSVVDKF